MFRPTPVSVLPLLYLPFYVPIISVNAQSLPEKKITNRTTLNDERVSKSRKNEQS